MHCINAGYLFSILYTFSLNIFCPKIWFCKENDQLHVWRGAKKSEGEGRETISCTTRDRRGPHIWAFISELFAPKIVKSEAIFNGD